MPTVEQPSHHRRRRTGAGDRSIVFAVMLVYFLSGVCSLIDQVVWVRLLKLTFGNTVYATSMVVSVFMGGLALGAYLMSRYADRVRRRLRLYAQLELLASVSALSIPFALQAVDSVYCWVFRHTSSSTVLLLVQVILSAAILLVPTMVMGSTLPLLARYVALLEARVGGLVGKLYALNMLGAALGCFLAGFVLIRALGVMGALYTAAFVNILVAIGGWGLSLVGGSATIADSAARAPDEAVDGSRLQADETGTPYLLAVGIFASGLVCIAYEILWMRSVVFPLRGTTYVFSSVLTIYLLGNVLGVSIGSRLANRLERPAMAFGLSLALLGLLGLIYVPTLVFWNFKLAKQILPLFGPLVAYPRLTELTLPFLYSFCLLIVPSTVMGIGFPLAVQQWCALRRRAGRTTGVVYGINTTGGVLGGVITGFALIPFLGVQLSIVLLGLLLLWLGTVIAFRYSQTERPWAKFSLFLIPVAGSVLAFLVPADMFIRGFFILEHQELVVASEGVTTTVAVHRDERNQLTLSTSGMKVAGDNRDMFRIPQKVLAHLGILLNRNTRTAVTVGFGSGETTACMSRHGLDRVDGVELSPELVEVSLANFGHLNLGERLHQEVNMHFMDAKNYLHLTDRTFDLIVNDCINPKEFAENASLYTKEYFESASGRLNPGGIFATYLPINEISVSCINSILGTFFEVFPHATIWLPVTAPSDYYDFFYVAGSNEAPVFSIAYIDEVLSRPAVRESTSYINLIDSRYVLSCYLGDRDDLARYLSEYSPNTDYTPFVEFTPDQDEPRPLKHHWLANFLADVRGDSLFRYVDWTGITAEDRQAWEAEFGKFRDVASYLLRMRGGTRNFGYILQDLSDASKVMPEHLSLRQQEQLALQSVRGYVARQRPNASEIAEQMQELLAMRPEIGLAWLVRSWAAQNLGDTEAAIEYARKAADLAPDSVEARENLESLLRGAGDPEGDKSPAPR